MRLIRENLFNWRYVYTHLIFFKITSLSINTPLPAVLPRVVARLEVLNWDLLQSIRHGSVHVFNSPKMVSFKLDWSRGNKKKSGRGNAAPTSLQPRPGPTRFLLVSPAPIQLERTPFWDCLTVNMQAAVMNGLKEIPVQDFQASYDIWQSRWQWCIDAQGCYFEEY